MVNDGLHFPATCKGQSSFSFVGIPIKHHTNDLTMGHSKSSSPAPKPSKWTFKGRQKLSQLTDLSTLTSTQIFLHQQLKPDRGSALPGILIPLPSLPQFPPNPPKTRSRPLRQNHDTLVLDASSRSRNGTFRFLRGSGVADDR